MIALLFHFSGIYYIGVIPLLNYGIVINRRNHHLVLTPQNGVMSLKIPLPQVSFVRRNKGVFYFYYTAFFKIWKCKFSYSKTCIVLVFKNRILIKFVRDYFATLQIVRCCFNI